MLNKSLLKNQDVLEVLANHTFEAVAILDKNETIVWSNSQMKDLLSTDTRSWDEALKNDLILQSAKDKTFISKKMPATLFKFNSSLNDEYRYIQMNSVVENEVYIERDEEYIEFSKLIEQIIKNSSQKLLEKNLEMFYSPMSSVSFSVLDKISRPLELFIGNVLNLLSENKLLTEVKREDSRTYVTLKTILTNEQTKVFNQNLEQSFFHSCNRLASEYVDNNLEFDILKSEIVNSKTSIKFQINFSSQKYDN